MTPPACAHCGSTSRASNGQCRCRRAAADRRRRAGPPPEPPAAAGAAETGVAALPEAAAAAFLAWLPASQIADVEVRVANRGGRCVVTVQPAVAYSLWRLRA